MTESVFDAALINEIFEFDKSKDRRQKKTHMAVETALITLLQKKNYDQISILEVAELADVNRKTFYNNYSSLDDVIESIDRKLSAYVISKLPRQITIKNEIEIYNLFLNFAIITEPHKSIIRKISRNRGIIVLFEDIENMILPYIERSMMNYHVDASVIPYVSKFIISGMTSLFREWLMNDNLDTTQIAKLSYNLVISACNLENYASI